VLVLLRKKRNNFYPNELNEVVISDSKFALAKEKSGKVIVKLRLRNCLRNQVNLAILSTVAGLEINGNQSSAGKNLGYYIRGGTTDKPLF
jgi:vitamin B12 transporter